MAKRKTAKRRGTMYYPKKRGKRRKSNSNTALMGAIIGGGTYGAARKFMAQLTAPIVEKIPGGQYADNLVMGTIDYLIFKNTSGIIKKAAYMGIGIESAMLGSELTGSMGNNTTTITGGW